MTRQPVSNTTTVAIMLAGLVVNVLAVLLNPLPRLQRASHLEECGRFASVPDALTWACHKPTHQP